MKIIIGNKNYSSWSLRPWLVLKHFGIDFEEVVIPLDIGDYKNEIKKHSPSGRVPALVDGDITIWDSLAIINYLAAKLPTKNIWPKKIEDKALAFSMSAEMHSGFSDLRQVFPMSIKRDIAVKPPTAVKKNIERIEEIWNLALKSSGGPFLFGKFSAADAMFAPVVFRFASYRVETGPEAKSYIETMLAHPAMIEWRDEALKEVWSIEDTDKLYFK